MTSLIKPFNGIIHSTVELSEDAVLQFKSNGISIEKYNPEKIDECQILLVSNEDDFVSWYKITRDFPDISIISWGDPKDKYNFLVTKGFLSIDPSLFLKSEDYRSILIQQLYHKSSIHLLDKWQKNFDEMVKATVAHPLRFGSIVDQIVGYSSLEKDISFEVRGVCDRIFILFHELHKSDKIHYPVHVEYVKCEKHFSLTFTAFTEEMIMEDFLPYVHRIEEQKVTSSSLVTEMINLSHHLEIAHFFQLKKIHLHVTWFYGEEKTGSSYWHNVFTKSLSLKRNILQKNVFLSSEKPSEEDWDKAFEQNVNTRVPDKSLNVEELLNKAIIDLAAKKPKSLDRKIALSELEEIWEDQTKKLSDLKEISTEQKELLEEMLNDPDVRLKTLDAFEEISQKMQSVPELTEAKKEKLINEISQDIAQKLGSGSLDEVLSEKISTLCETEDNSHRILDSDDEPIRKQKIKSLIDSKKINLNHPYLEQAIKSATDEELEDPDAFASKMHEISKFLRKTKNLKNPKIDRVIDSYLNNEIDFESASDLVEKMIDVGLKKVSSSFIEDELSKVKGSKENENDEIFASSFLSPPLEDDLIELTAALEKVSIESFKTGGSEKDIAERIDEAIPLLSTHNQKNLRKNKNDYTSKIQQQIEALAKKLGKKPSQLTDEEIASEVKVVVSGVTQKIAEHNELIRGEKLKDPNFAFLVPAGDLSFVDHLEKIPLTDKQEFLARQFASQIKASQASGLELTQDTFLLNDLAQSTGLSLDEILTTINLAKNKNDQVERDAVAIQILDVSAKDEMTMLDDIALELYENQDDASFLKSKDGHKTFVKAPKNISEKTTQVVSDKSEDLLKLHALEYEKKQIQAENIRLKAKLQAQEIKNRITPKEVVHGDAEPINNEVQEITKIHHHQKLSKDPVEVVKEPLKERNEKSSISPVKDLNSHSNISASPLKVLSKGSIEPPFSQTPNSSIDANLENELQKLSLENKKKDLILQKLKEQQTQSLKNFQEKIQRLQAQLNEQPMVREIKYADPEEHPAFVQMQKENDRLKLLNEKFEDRIKNVQQNLTKENKVEKSVDDYEEKRKLKKEIDNLKNKLRLISSKEQTQKSFPSASPLEPAKNQKVSPLLPAFSSVANKQNESQAEKESTFKGAPQADSNSEIVRGLQHQLKLAQSELQRLKHDNNFESETLPDRKGTNVDPPITNTNKTETKINNSIHRSNRDESDKELLQDYKRSNITLQNRVNELEKILSKKERENQTSNLNESTNSKVQSIAKGNNIDSNFERKNNSDAAQVSRLELNLKRIEQENIALKEQIKKSQSQANNKFFEPTTESNSDKTKEPAIANNEKVVESPLNSQEAVKFKQELHEMSGKLQASERTIEQLNRELERMKGQMPSGQTNQEGPKLQSAPLASSPSDSEIKKDLAKARESELVLKKDLAAATNKLNFADS